MSTLIANLGHLRHQDVLTINVEPLCVEVGSNNRSVWMNQ
jgi:hypothetical protein